MIKWIKRIRFIPSIDILASSDGGKTYSQQLTRINNSKVIYIKFILQIKTKWFWRLLWGNTVEFSIEHPYNDMYNCELFDYSFCEYEENSVDDVKKDYQVTVIETPDTSAADNVKRDYQATVIETSDISAMDNAKRTYQVTVIGKKRKKNGQYKVSVSKNKNITFSMLASKRSQKTEIVFKLTKSEKQPEKQNNGDNAFTISFEKSIHKTYIRKARLGFINCLGECL